MKSLTEMQAEELVDAVFAGDVDFCELVGLGQFICWHRGDTLRRMVQCASNAQARALLSAISHLPNCPKH